MKGANQQFKDNTFKFLFLFIMPPLLLILNAIFISYILHDEPIYSEKKYPIHIKKPLVLKHRLTSIYKIKNPIKLLENKFGIHLDKNISLPTYHPLLVDLKWVMNANPYPPLLSEYSDDDAPDYLSFGYIDISGKYQQVTYYFGEADTTPSFFVSKVRGKETYSGDYYISYTIYLSKRIIKKPLITDSRTQEVIEWNPPPKYPKIAHIEWTSYAGDGYEEFSFILITTPIQIFLIYWFFIFRRRKKSMTPTQGSGNYPQLDSHS